MSSGSHAIAAESRTGNPEPPAGTPEPQPLRLFDSYPRSAAVAAALGISFAAIFFVLSETSPSTATVFRCLYALPLLWWLARREDAVFGPRPWAARRWTFLAGVFFAVDLLFFHHSIQLMGAGLATVLINLQVVIVLFAAWLIWGERPSMTQAVGVPLALGGIVLISGLFDADAYGEDPLMGSVLGIVVALAYASYLLLLRKGKHRHRAAGPILDSTLACMVTALAAGLVVGDLDPIPSLPEHFWLLLLALTAQVGGAVMLAVALPRLPAATTSLILLIQPVLATIFAIIILSETPSTAQFVGVALIIGGVLLGSAPGRTRRGRPEPAVGAPGT